VLAAIRRLVSGHGGAGEAPGVARFRVLVGEQVLLHVPHVFLVFETGTAGLGL